MREIQGWGRGVGSLVPGEGGIGNFPVDSDSSITTISFKLFLQLLSSLVFTMGHTCVPHNFEVMLQCSVLTMGCQTSLTIVLRLYICLCVCVSVRDDLKWHNIVNSQYIAIQLYTRVDTALRYVAIEILHSPSTRTTAFVTTLYVSPKSSKCNISITNCSIVL